MNLYDTTLLAAWERVSGQLRPAGFPRPRWEVLVNGQWFRQPVYGRPEELIKGVVKDMIDEGLLDLDDPAAARTVRSLMLSNPYPRMNRLHDLLLDTGRYVP